MKVIVNHPRIIGGKLYAKSKLVQEIPDKHMDHWFPQALIKAGDLSAAVESNAKAAKIPVKEKEAS